MRGAVRARTLLSKAFALIDQFSLDETELRYLLGAPPGAAFAGVNLSQLPADLTDVSPTQSSALFQQFLSLAKYVHLRQEIAGGNDDLIGILQCALRQTAAAGSQAGPAQPDVGDIAGRLAQLTRRERATVSGAMRRLGFPVVVGSAIAASPAAAGSTATSTAASPAVPAGSAAPGSAGTAIPTLPPSNPDLALEKLWRLLKLIQKVGLGADAVARWATSAPNAIVAQELRQAAKARYETPDWLVVAPPIFDKLRRLQRDALVAFIVHRNGFESRDQLFEYFLIDPGMEPVVQTSRLRVAISSVQTFVQRCLLNLEPQVQPAALSSEQWQWMKQYRIWQAAREIFLFPESYMEMEFRDDKTDLFVELEGTLLQSDVSDDVAEDALYTYLKKLEDIARLDIVSMCSEEDETDPDGTALHVIARTHTSPPKYYYRRYAHQMWTSWETITATIVGDHVVAVFWRDRLNVFWLSFIHQGKTDSDGSSDSDSGDRGGGDEQDDNKPLKDIKLSEMMKATRPGLPPKVIQVQLNWAEYYQGKWSTPSASAGDDDSDGGSNGGDSDTGGSAGGVGYPVAVIVPPSFDPSEVTVHAVVDFDSDPEAACIHVAFPDTLFVQRFRQRINVKHGRKAETGYASGARPEWRPKRFAFRIISKFAPPVVEPGTPQIAPPFPELAPMTNHFVGHGSFQVQYVESIETVDHQAPKITQVRRDILNERGRGTSARQSLTVLGAPINAEQPEIGVLESPFFIADRQNTFFVEPALTETTIDKWEHWAIPVSKPAGRRPRHGAAVVASFPSYRAPKSLPKGVKPFTGTFEPGARYRVHVPSDAVTDADSVVHFGGSAVGGAGATAAVAPRTAAKSSSSKAAAVKGHR